ncbi:MAG: response regulator [Candidatus Magasanikiibacteriota bacterium]
MSTVKILIIDDGDEKVDRLKGYDRLGHLHGVEVVRRWNFNSALKEGPYAFNDLEQTKFDVIILDFTLPMDRFGHEILDKIRHSPRFIINERTVVIGISTEWKRLLQYDFGLNLAIYKEETMADELETAIKSFVATGKVK